MNNKTLENNVANINIRNVIDMLWYSEFREFLENDGIRDQIISDYNRLRKYAKINPKLYKQQKDELLHDNYSPDNILYQLMISQDYYKRTGILFNSIIRCSNDLRLSSERIKELKNNEIPPVFDNIQSEIKDVNKILRLIDDRKIYSVNKIMDDLKDEFSRIEEDEYIVLTNGSTTGFQHMNYDIYDINSIAYWPPQEFVDKTKPLCKYLGVLNYTNDENMLYNEYRSDCYGELLYIPDKEGKIRGIYRMYPWVQVVSKKLHIKLDRVARRIPGNYTYDQTGWFRHITNEGYLNSKYIVTTDMSKYSDTLDVELIMGIMKRVLPSYEVYRSFKWLFTLPILDRLNRKLYSNPNGSYQGQYGDFPLITIINAILQRIVYYRTGQRTFKYCTAVVGDDTGFVFETKDDRILDKIIEVYGWAGVNINRSKTHILDNGTGYGDFIKREITGSGIITYFNMSLFESNNMDGIIRWIFDDTLITHDMDLQKARLNIIFGDEFGNMLNDLSILNGGTSLHALTENDIVLFKSRMNTINGYYERTDELKYWFRDYRNVLQKSGQDLADTVFQGWVNLEGFQEWASKSGNTSLSDYIQHMIFNTDYLGIRYLDKKFDVDKLIGINPEPILNCDDINKLTGSEEILFILLNSYEKKEAIRNRERRSKQKSSIYYSMFKLPLLPTLKLELNPEIPVKDQDEYKEAVREKYIIDTAYKLSRLVISEGPIYGHYYRYIRINGIVYNILYDSSNKPRLTSFLLKELFGIELRISQSVINRLKSILLSR